MSMIQIPDELYAQIAERAAKAGQPVDAFVIARLTRDMQTEVLALDSDEYEEGYDPATDPLAKFAGMYASNDPGWIERHDEIFGKHHAEQK